MQEPGRSAWPRVLVQAIAIFIVSLVVLGWSADRRLNSYDEGIILTGAARVAAGEVPHRDFYTNYGPAQLYLLAGLFKVFGQTALVERALDTAVRAAIVALSFAIVAARARSAVAFACALVCLLWLFARSFHGYPVFPTTLLLLACAPLVARAPGGAGARRSTALAGAVVGLVALFRYDVGLAALLGLGAVIALQAAQQGRDAKARMAGALSAAWPFVAGAAAVCVPVALAYLAVAPIGPFLHDIFTYPVQHYARMRSLPFPAPWAEPVIYLPPLACLVAVYGLWVHPLVGPEEPARPVPDGATRGLQIALVVITALLYAKGFVRISDIHIIGAILASAVLLTLLVADGLRDLPGRVAAGLSVAMIAVTLFAAAQAGQSRAAALAFLGPQLLSGGKEPGAGQEAGRCGLPPELQSVACFWPGRDSAQAALFLAKYTQAGERVFVGAMRHDKLFANDMVLYFAANRLPGTRWAHFDPGLQTTEAVQREMIGELRAHGVRFAVLNAAWDRVAEPNESAKSSGVHLLDEHLRSEFQPVATVGAITILARKQAPGTPVAK